MASLESPLYKEAHKIGLLASLALTTSGLVRVEFYSDRLVIYSGKKLKDIRYTEIKRIWKGHYRLSPRGTKVYVEDFPGSRMTSKAPAYLPNGRRVQEMLVLNSATRINYMHCIPLVLERQDREHVDILHVQNEGKVIEIFKAHAPTIQLSPVFDV